MDLIVALAGVGAKYEARLEPRLLTLRETLGEDKKNGDDYNDLRIYRLAEDKFWVLRGQMRRYAFADDWEYGMDDLDPGQPALTAFDFKPPRS